jgi:hypothetical protein
LPTSGTTRPSELATQKGDDSLRYYIKMHRMHIGQLETRIQILTQALEAEEREAAKRGIDLNAI